MIEKSALIVGLARDCAEGLRATLPRIERFRSTFSKCKFVVVTNESIDDTDDVLNNWASTSNNIEIIALDGLKSTAPERTVRLAIARNAYISTSRRDHERGEHHDFLVVVDLDGLNANLIDDPDFTAVLGKAPEGWGALFANQRDTYYDLWALRHPTWCPGDCWEPVRLAKKRWFGRKAAVAAAKAQLASQLRHIAPTEQPVAVDSAFGGFGIYRTEFLVDAAYRGLTDEGKAVCEHVAFNEKVRQNGALLYILPPLLNDTHP